MEETERWPGAGRISFERMEALQRDLIVAGADGSSALQAFRISDATREYVANGPYQSVTDTKVKTDLAKIARLVRCIAELDLGATAEMNILWDFYSDEAKSFEPSYRALREAMASHYETWPTFAKHLQRMSDSIIPKPGDKPNLCVRLLWADAMRHWHRMTGRWPVTTRDRGLPKAPLYTHVTAMIWELTDDDELREPARGAKPFMYVLGCLRDGADPLAR